MSSSSLEDLSEPVKQAQRTAQGMVKVGPDQMTPGRQKLRSWLGKYFRVVITDGRILVGVLSCTDKDANIVLSGCVEYISEDGEPRILGNVMVPGKHIRSVEVERRPSEEPTAPPTTQATNTTTEAPKQLDVQTQGDIDTAEKGKSDYAELPTGSSSEPALKSEPAPEESRKEKTMESGIRLDTDTSIIAP